MLDYSKLVHSELKFNFSKVEIRKTVSFVKTIIGSQAIFKGLKFDIDIPNEIPDLIYTDETRLKQVLINLVGNALKFTDEGSIKIGLSVEEVEIKDEEEKANAIKFKITDTG